MNKSILLFIVVLFFVTNLRCATTRTSHAIQSVNGLGNIASGQIWLSHEHLLVDFIGAENIQKGTWSHEEIINHMLPYLNDLKKYNVKVFVDATPNYLGRDVKLLEKLSKRSGINIITNTGLYGARNNKFIPKYAQIMTATELANIWIDEFSEGIDGTLIKPGFIKIGIDSKSQLSKMHQKLVRAAALTHLKTGLTIASHTGRAEGLWPQLEIIKSTGVSPKAFIWIHAQNEDDLENFLKAAESGCWISLDAAGKKIEKHIKLILYAKKHGFLDQILLSHDAGWYDPQKTKQLIKPYTPIFELLQPRLKSEGITDAEFKMLVSSNSLRAFHIEIKKDPIEF